MFITRFTPKGTRPHSSFSSSACLSVRFSILGGVLYLYTLLPPWIINRELHQHASGSTTPLSRDLKNPNCKWYLLYLLVGSSNLCHFSEKHHVFPQDADKVHVVRPVPGTVYDTAPNLGKCLLSSRTKPRLSSNCMYLLYMRCYIYMIRVYLKYVPRCPISDTRKKEMVFISQGTHLISEVRARVLFYFIQA